MDRVGDWIQTYTGKAAWPLDLRVEDIDVLDIAHSLSLQCRFAGHCLRFYSVAEHCVLMSRAIEPEYAFQALMHDASEAYLVDVPRPLKPLLIGYKEAEARIEETIGRKFGVAPGATGHVKWYDTRMLATEMEQNMSAPPMPWSNMAEPLDIKLQFWTPGEARLQFLQTFDLLKNLQPQPDFA